MTHDRARPRSQARIRSFWIIAAGTVAGCGIWGTHFVAMLAYRAGIPVGYDTSLTLLSIVIAISLCSGGFCAGDRARRRHHRRRGRGAAISAMHYVGMAAVRAPALAIWSAPYVAASIVIGVVLTAARACMWRSAGRDLARCMRWARAFSRWPSAACISRLWRRWSICPIPTIADAQRRARSRLAGDCGGRRRRADRGAGPDGAMLDHHLAERAIGRSGAAARPYHRAGRNQARTGSRHPCA